MATLKKRIRIAAAPAAVHRALTDPAALQIWLAERAEVELPGRYEFWGRFTPDGEAPRQRLLYADDSSLSFEWELDGVTTVVSIELEAENESTLVTLTQTEVIGWPEMLTTAGDRAVMHTYWALALANLADHVEGRQPVALCDFTTPEMHEELLIDADRLAVYASLSEPEQFSRWAGIKVEAELEPGGRWAMGGFEANSYPAHVVDIEPGRSMSIDWGEMVQSWELDDSDGKTRLTFVHSGFDKAKPPYDGWMGSLAGLAELRRFHEVADWRMRWVEVQVEGLPEDLIQTG
ncbi:SRPBCC family protein [Paractinoplanes durhamensis]|uniref:Activator of Hsp90 ATPase homologue 1/2-like C-terminal domain-containing protein n=1 Tax=Paractinoplanes durhamensis TaxID=113563 RepID=A0ABQ3ZA97_9ACTN|nr:SRPBCC domain-containing protein [Actinoplanes durhamensis]GIE06711.1 hypothetical protein Adu01nite_80610 [Actinoplanes durhamensis]